ncbi:unnamed protein product, partial [marine sediment metagenome]
ACAKWDLIPSSQRGLAYFVKGSILQGLDRNDEAIKVYHKALADPKLDTPGNAWHNLGFSYSLKGEHDEAIKAYHKASSDPKFDMSGNMWLNLGNAYSDKGEYDEAIKA